VAGWVNI